MDRAERYHTDFFGYYEHAFSKTSEDWSDNRKRQLRDYAMRAFDAFCLLELQDRLAIRSCMATYSLELARFGVLVMKADPAPDDTGYRDGKFVTGELCNHLDQIFRKQGAMDLLGIDDSWSINDPASFCRARYEGVWLIANCFNFLRLSAEGPTKPDWYRPSGAVLYAFAEYQFRYLLGLPRALADDNANTLVPLKYGLLPTLIAEGESDPYQTWLRL